MPAHDERNNDDGPWNEYRRLIIRQLQSLVESVDRLEDKLDHAEESQASRLAAMQKAYAEDKAQLAADIAVLKFKSSLWGGISGAIGGALMAAIAWLTGSTHH